MNLRATAALSPILAICLAVTLPSAAQQAGAPDPELDAASATIGRALFLRCLCAENNLTYDAAGKLSGNVKKADWTVSGVNIQKVARKGSSIELQGVRVVVRFATDRREWDRKPQDDEPVHVTIATTEDRAAFRSALHAVFAQGIDRELQLATPAYWQHFFDPNLKWPDDELTNAVIMSIPAPTADSTLAAVTHHVEAGYTVWAGRGQVAGSVRLRFVVDTQGNPHHITIVTPLGYGLDEKAAEAVEKYHFSPATHEGKAVNSNVSMDETFKFVALQQ